MNQAMSYPNPPPKLPLQDVREAGHPKWRTPRHHHLGVHFNLPNSICCRSLVEAATTSKELPKDTPILYFKVDASLNHGLNWEYLMPARIKGVSQQA
jgi:hypothetical protein